VFDFGKNWQDYSTRVLDEPRLDSAKTSLQALLGGDSLEGKSFLDIGFGSGIFSIGASLLGANPVRGIDISAESVAAADANAARFLSDAKAPEFRQGSILDPKTQQELGSADIVYSWGVLHHTGHMWEAIRNTAALVATDGVLSIAIYNKHITSPLWNVIKWFYNISPAIVKRAMYYLMIPVIVTAKFLVTGKNPLNKRRGMDFFVDIIDWIGGYPYEYATPQEVIDFVTALGFELITETKATTPIGCNEFVFRKTDAPV
jgi:SAM-dependent methyltransferase